MNWKIYLLLAFLGIAPIFMNSGCSKLENKTLQQANIQISHKNETKDFDHILHYWNSFNFSDTAAIVRPDVTEQAFINYLVILSNYDSITISNSIENLLDQTKQQDSTTRTHNYFLELFDHYLYDPNSPFRNETLYIPVLKYVLRDSSESQTIKQQAKFKLEEILKNRPGSIAANLTYTTIDGNNNTLYEIESPHTLVYFYNPDCSACKEITIFLKTSQVVNSLLQDGKLSILAVYTDTDIQLWRKHLNEVPFKWIVGYDKEQHIHKQHLYGLRAIPSLYLLDKDKRVLLKDANATDVEKLLSTFLG